MSINRELSQLASFIDVQEDNNFIGISTGGTYTVGIGTSSVIIGATGIITATQFNGPTGSSLIDHIDLQDEGNLVGTGFTTLNFVGTGVTITEGASGIATVTIIGTEIIGTSGEIDATDNGDGTTTLSLPNQVAITSSLTVGTVKIESGIITATSGIVTYNGDGSGLINVPSSALSGLSTDSEKLDGQDGSYYLDYANFSGIATDSSLLDGIDSGSFLRSDVADTKTGVTTFSDDLTIGSNSVETDLSILGATITYSDQAGGYSSNLNTKFYYTGLGLSSKNFVISVNHNTSSQQGGLLIRNATDNVAEFSHISNVYTDFHPTPHCFEVYGGSIQIRNDIESADYLQAPPTLSLWNRVEGSSFTSGDEIHRIDFVAQDASGPGSGTIIRIADVINDTTGADHSLKFFTSDTPNGSPLTTSLSLGPKATELYYLGSKKFETTAAGVTITGIATATTFSGSGASLTNIPTSALVGLATDADKLDGQDGTYYLNYSNFVGVATDADKLDGQQGTYYLDYSNFTNTPPDIRWFGTAVGIWTSSSVGIGTTNPTGKLEVHGNARITGILTVGSSSITIDGDNDQLNVGSTVTINSTGYTVGNSFLHSTGLDGENLNITGISTLGTVQISSGIITASSGIVTYYGDGTNLTLTDSVALGGDTTGDYVASISGTANQIAVDVTSGEGTTPVISIPNNPTLPGTTVTIENDLQVNRDLNVTGNITIGGTSATLFTQTLSVADADLILGVRTDANGNDVSTDTTASHGGIAIASTEGTPLVTLVNPGAGETLPSTYKKIMWFEQGALAGLGTDAWLINYGVGIGSTQVPNNVVLAAGDVHVTNNDIIKVGDINASGIITASTFVSNVSTGTSPLTVTSTTLVSNLNADKLDGQEGTYYLNYANFSGIATDSDKLDGQEGTYYLNYANFSGIATDSDKLDGQQGTYYLSYNNFVGLATDSDKLDGQDGSYYLNYSNFSGIATDSDKLDGQQGSYYLDYANFSGIATDSDKLDGQQGTYYLNYANFVGLATDSDKLDGQQGSYYLDYANFSGIATDSDKLDGQQGTYYLSYSNFVGLATDSDKLDGQQGSYYLDYANFSGIATDSDKLDGQQGTYYLNYANFSGIATDSDKLDGQQGTYYLDYANFSGIATDSDKLDGQEGTYYLDYANFSGIATDSDKLDGQQGTYYLDYANFSGIATDSDKLDGQEGSYYLNYSNFSGIATDSDKLDGQQGTYYLDYSNFVGVATDSDKLDGQQGTYYLDYSNFVGVATDSSLLDGIDSNSFLRSDAADFKTSGNLTFNDSIRLQLGTGGDLELYHNGSTSYIKNSIGNLHIENQSDNSSIIIRTDDGSGGDTNYIDCNGLTGEVRLFHYGAQKLATKANGIDVTGHTETDTLNVSGIATAQDFNSASDENLKTNIRTIEDPLAKVVQIRGVNFDWKETQRPSLGVIAQEVEKVLPELVTDNGTKTVNYNGLIGLLIEAVKAQQEEIDILKSKIK